MRPFPLTLLVAISLSSFTQGRPREFELYLRDSPRQFALYENEYSVSVYDSLGASICYFSRSEGDSMGVFKRWQNYQLFSEEIVLEEFLSCQNFKAVENKLPFDDILCEVILLDSLEGEMLPCGNADFPEPVMKYNFLQQVSIGRKVLVQHRYQHASFSFHFDHVGYQRYLEDITNIWKDSEAKCWYVLTEGGFVIVPFQDGF